MWAIRREKAVIVEPETETVRRGSMTLGDAVFPAERPDAPCAVVVDGDVAGRLIEDCARMLSTRREDDAETQATSLATSWISVEPGAVGCLKALETGVHPSETMSSALSRMRPVCSHMPWSKSSKNGRLN